METTPHAVYKRYQIDKKKTPNILPHPHRFQVRVKKLELAKLLLKECIRYRGKLDVILSRPCVYGVFSGPVGGFAPRERLCVGCLRCTTQYPKMITILHNPERQKLGDAYFTPDYVDTVVYEAETGSVPVKGQGFRGRFGGEGWDGLWTDMSEIVRPTRDGIYGREYISTEVDIGEKPPFLTFDAQQHPTGYLPRTFSIPLPFLLDTLSPSLLDRTLCQILSEAARQLQTFSILPFKTMLSFSLKELHLIPLLDPADYRSFKEYGFEPKLIELSKWDLGVYQAIRADFPHTLPVLRTDFEDDLLAYFQAGVRIFHLTANYHGRGKSGKFVLDLIRRAHLNFVEAGCREEVTLIGSGGIIAAEHVPKAILCGLDAVSLDTPLLVALQAAFKEEGFQLPSQLTVPWGVQRLKNLAGSWRDQLFEILGAMGLREVRRLRGEMGRALLQKDLEKEAFAGIKGYE